MATTTNYSWSTPDDTALVKDGAAAIRSLGTAIDSTVFTNAGAAIAKTIVDAKGDLIVGTAADTVARLAVGGTNGHVLQVDSSTASGLKWDSVAAGGITLLSTTSITTSSTTVSGINQTYRDLIVRVDGPKMTSASGDELTVRLNSVTTSSYNYTRYTTTATSFTNFAATSYKFNNLFLGTAANNTYAQINIPDYANTATKKSITAISQDESTSTLWMVGNLDSTGAISSVTITNALGLAMDGGTIRIYGVK